MFCQQVAPELPNGRSWDDAREEVADLMIGTVDRMAPGFKASVLGRQILSPLDLERTFGLVGGDIMHGALSLDQLYSARPVLGHGNYRAPVAGLYMCGSGTHPGGGGKRRAGAQRSARDHQGSPRQALTGLRRDLQINRMDQPANPSPTGTLATALAHAERLLANRPALAEEQAREILKSVPGHPHALLLLAAARRGQNDTAGACDILEPLARSNPNLVTVHLALGSVLTARGATKAAAASFARATALDPSNAAAWRMLGDLYTMLEDRAAADAAYARNIKASVNDPQLVEAATALCEGRLAVAERLLRTFVKEHPTDVAAIRMLAETGARLGAMKMPKTCSHVRLSLRRAFWRRGRITPPCCTGR